MIRPRRLVLAGIDLEVIEHALACFDGELEILSPALAGALRERAPSRRFC